MRFPAAFPAALLTAVALADPPPDTLQRLGTAFHALDEGVFIGSYTVTVETTVSTTSGEVTDTATTVVAVTVPPDGPLQQRILRAQKNGKDVTAEVQPRSDKNAERKRGGSTAEKEKEDKGSFSFRTPDGDDARHYVFAAAACGEGTCTAAFEPRPEARKEKNLVRGRLGWDAGSGEPLWIELAPVDLPSGVKELTVRFEFERAGGVLFPVRTVADGVGGVLFVKRAFHTTTTISDLRPSVSTPAAADPPPAPRHDH